MRRVASLYLPYLSIDRLRRIEGRRAKPPEHWDDRPLDLDPLPRSANPLKDCSCPRGGHWRPGAGWAKIEAEIARLTAHRRPTHRELGRRSEAAAVPFKGMERRTPPRPALADRNPPLVTTLRDRQRSVIAAACPIAQALGLMPGMALTQARAIVPTLDVHEADAAGDMALLTHIGEFAARRISPLTALSSADGLWLDLTGTAHLHGGEERFCARLLRFCARLGLQARVAVAGNAAAAHALARFGQQHLLLCPDGAEQAHLEPMPLAALRLAPETATAMNRLGIDTVGDLIEMPRAPLVRRFGRDMLMRLDQALGRAAEPFDPIVPRDAPATILRFAEPIGNAETIARAIGELLERLEDILREQALGARALLLICERVDRHEERVAVGTARATRDKGHLLRLLSRKIETIDPGFGIDAIRLIAARTEPLGAAHVPGDLAAPEPVPDLAELIDLIGGRIGPRNLYRLSCVESEVPERIVRRIASLDTPIPSPDAWPRPARLLPRPEPIGNVIAELPDAPPRRFTWRGKTHILVRGDGPERIFGEWWKRSSEREAVRDYFQVEDESGARFWLFRKGNGENPSSGDLSWWIHGSFG